MMIHAVIADDEAPARRKLARFLAEHADIDLAGEAETGTQAVELVARAKPHVVFLDIHMPELDGLGVAQTLLGGAAPPALVFVTAFDAFAVRAFDLHALDYLLKPYDRERFDRMLDRVRTTTAVPAAGGSVQLAALLSTLRSDKGYARRILVPSDGRSIFIATREIVRLEADGNNVIVHARGGSRYELRATLESLEDRLDPQYFARVHRSHVVNIDEIAEIHPWFHGDHRLRLRDGTEIAWSRRFAARRADLLT